MPSSSARASARRRRSNAVGEAIQGTEETQDYVVQSRTTRLSQDTKKSVPKSNLNFTMLKKIGEKGYEELAGLILDPDRKKEKAHKKAEKEKIKAGKEKYKQLEEMVKGTANNKWNGMKARGIEDHIESEAGLLSFHKGDVIYILDCGVVDTNPASKVGGGGGIQTGYFEGKIGLVVSHCIEFVYTESENLPTAQTNLLQLLVKPDQTVVRSLCNVTDRSQIEYLTKAIVDVFRVEGNILELIKYSIRREVADTSDSTTLFRNNSIASFMMSAYCKMLKGSFLRDMLRPLLDELFANTHSFELDPQKTNELFIEENAKELRIATEKFTRAILQSVPCFPMGVRRICKVLLKEVEQMFPDSTYIAIGGFVFLRYLVPAIVAPEAFGLATVEEMTPDNRRKLVLISKSLQSLGNMVNGFKKEPYMLPMSDFLNDNMEKVKTFFSSLANVDDKTIEPEEKLGWESVSKKSVVTLHQQLSYKLCVLAESLLTVTKEQNLSYNPLQSLLEILDALGPLRTRSSELPNRKKRGSSLF